MLDFIMFFNAVFETFSRLRRPFARSLIQPLLTASMLTALYAGYHVVHESSLTDGLKVAFFESNADRASRLREREDAILQAELHHMAESNQVIDRVLQSLTGREPTIARARLDVIHNGVTGVTGMGLLRYDVTNSVAGMGHAPGSLVQNLPLTEWSEFLPDMLAGTCKVVTVGDLRGAAFRARLEMLNAGTLLVCPVADMQGRLLGAIFISWDAGTRVPDGNDMDQLIGAGKQAGIQIATVLDLRTSPGQHYQKLPADPRDW